MRPTTLLTLAAAMLMSPAALAYEPEVSSPSTSNRLECISTFRDLDRNWNGWLDPYEMNPYSKRLPTNVRSWEPIRETEFVDRCSGGRMLPQSGNNSN